MFADSWNATFVVLSDSYRSVLRPNSAAFLRVAIEIASSNNLDFLVGLNRA